MTDLALFILSCFNLYFFLLFIFELSLLFYLSFLFLFLLVVISLSSLVYHIFNTFILFYLKWVCDTLMGESVGSERTAKI